MSAPEFLYRNKQNGLDGELTVELASIFPDLLELVTDSVAAPAPAPDPTPSESPSPTTKVSTY